MAKAIIEIVKPGAYREKALEIARGVDAGGDMPESDYHLGFVDAAQLFAELTPARLATLEALEKIGPSSIYALAKHLERNYSNVHSDIGKLLEHRLVDKDEEGKVHVPWEEVQIHITLRSEAA